QWHGLEQVVVHEVDHAQRQRRDEVEIEDAEERPDRGEGHARAGERERDRKASHEQHQYRCEHEESEGLRERLREHQAGPARSRTINRAVLASTWKPSSTLKTSSRVLRRKKAGTWLSGNISRSRHALITIGIE